MPLKVRFLDFSQDFKERDNFFYHLLKVNFDSNCEVVEDLRTEVDLEIVSTFVPKKLSESFSKYRSQQSRSLGSAVYESLTASHRSNYRTNASKRLWYSGENTRPPLGLFDGTMCFDVNNWTSGNLFLPYWVMRIDWYRRSKAYEIMPTLEQLLAPRSAELRKFRAVSFASQKNHYRERAINTLAKVIEIDSYGRSNGAYKESKLKTSSNYLFQICTENAVYPNYVTEKLHESWISGCVPIWSGLDSDGYFNPKAFYDITRLDSDQVLNLITGATPDEILFKQQQPILTKNYDLDGVIKFMGEHI